MVTALPLLAKSTLARDCYEALKRAIINLDLAPGAPIDEGQVAAQLGISKTPVREAIARLVGEGFCVLGMERKATVAEISIERVREIYDVRLMLEPASIRQITPFLTDEDVSGLARSVQRSQEALDRADASAFVAANETFHAALIQHSGNRYLIALSRGLFDHADRIRVAIHRTEQRAAYYALSTQGLENHRRIVAALASRDADNASAAMAADIRLFLERVDTAEMQEAFRQFNYRPATAI